MPIVQEAKIMTPDSSSYLSALIDKEKIREVKFEYCDALDRQDAAGIVKLFASNASYDVGRFGSYHGRDAISELLVTLLREFTLTSHTPTIGKIQVDGDTASATWKAVVAMAPKLSDAAGTSKQILAFIDYHDRFVRQGDAWFFSAVSLDIRGEWSIESRRDEMASA